jgi:hypothetical protein
MNEHNHVQYVDLIDRKALADDTEPVERSRTDTALRSIQPGGMTGQRPGTARGTV